MGEEKYHGEVMPEVYRAYEVILDMEWDFKIDIGLSLSWCVTQSSLLPRKKKGLLPFFLLQI